MKASHGLAAALLAGLLAACGGGGGGGGPAELRLATSSVVVAAQTTDVAPQFRISATLSRIPDRPITPSVTHTTNGIARVETAFDSVRSGQVSLFFKDPDRLPAGTYTDQVTLKVCYDTACTEQVAGRPRVVEVRYTVSGPAAPEPELALPVSAAPTDGGALAASLMAMADHDVVDAAFSEALGSIIMISTTPSNALYVYDAGEDTEARLDLAKKPVALSLAPDGKTVALLLEDAPPSDSKPATLRLAYAVLPDSGAPAALTERQQVLPTSDLLSGGNGFAYLLPGPVEGLPLSFITSIKLQDGATLASPFNIPFQLNGALHPTGQAIYAVRSLPETGGLLKIRANTDGSTALLYESEEDSAHPACGRLWTSATGNRLYTACGAIFRASDFRRNDLSHMGDLALFKAGSGIQSLSDSVTAGEIAAAENNSESCYREPVAECSSRLNFYDRETVAAVESLSLPEGSIAGFVFHDGGGDNVYVIVRNYRDATLPAMGPGNLLLKLPR